MPSAARKYSEPMGSSGDVLLVERSSISKTSRLRPAAKHTGRAKRGQFNHRNDQERSVQSPMDKARLATLGMRSEPVLRPGPLFSLATLDTALTNAYTPGM